MHSHNDVAYEFLKYKKQNFSRRRVIQASALASVGCIASQQNATSVEHDLRLLPSAPKLVAWHTAGQGITLSPNTKGFGTSPPPLQLGGNLNGAPPFLIDIDNSGGPLGTATFRWARNELGADSPLTLSPNWVQTGVPTAPTVALGTTGVNALFPAGTYQADNGWNSVTANWADVDNKSGCQLDNSSITVSNGVINENSSFLNGLPSLLFSPGMLGNQSVLASTCNNNAPFHVFIFGHIYVLPTAANTLVIWAVSSQTQTSKDFIDLFATGPSASPAKVYSLQRVSDSGGTPDRIDSNSTTQKTGLAPHIWEIGYKAPNLYLWMDGWLIGTKVVTGNLLVNRYSLFGIKLGANAATLFLQGRLSDHALYDDLLSDSERYDNLRALS